MMEEDIQKNKVVAAISYIWVLFILYWFVDSNFVKFHAKQSFVIFIAEVFVSISRYTFSFLPNYDIFSAIISSLLLILRILGFVYALSGQFKKVPVLGDLAERLKI